MSVLSAIIVVDIAETDRERAREHKRLPGGLRCGPAICRHVLLSAARREVASSAVFFLFRAGCSSVKSKPDDPRTYRRTQ